MPTFVTESALRFAKANPANHQGAKRGGRRSRGSRSGRGDSRAAGGHAASPQAPGADVHNRRPVSPSAELDARAAALGASDADPCEVVNLDTGERITLNEAAALSEAVDTFRASIVGLGGAEEEKEPEATEEETWWEGVWQAIVKAIWAPPSPSPRGSRSRDRDRRGRRAFESAPAAGTAAGFDTPHLPAPPSPSAASAASAAGQAPAPAPAPAAPKRTVRADDFQLVRPLGQGAFAKVFLARRKKDGREFAIKVFNKKMMGGSARQVWTEREVLARNKHPFVSALRFAYQTPTELIIGMDYYGGGPLQNHIDDATKFDEPTARFYAAELLLAVAHLHAAQIVHRDLKPDNCMLDNEGHLVLVDFGLAKSNIRGPRGARTLVGTPDYAAPEILRQGMNSAQPMDLRARQRDTTGVGYGKAADWWSYGVVVATMLLGEPPFHDSSLRQTYYNILNEPLRLPEELSSEAKQLLTGLLHRDPALRLGAWDDGESIKRHPWFAGLDFDALLRRELPAPRTGVHEEAMTLEHERFQSTVDRMFSPVEEGGGGVGVGAPPSPAAGGGAAAAAPAAAGGGNDEGTPAFVTPAAASPPTSPAAPASPAAASPAPGPRPPRNTHMRDFTFVGDMPVSALPGMPEKATREASAV